MQLKKSIIINLVLEAEVEHYELSDQVVKIMDVFSSVLDLGQFTYEIAITDTDNIVVNEEE